VGTARRVGTAQCVWVSAGRWTGLLRRMVAWLAVAPRVRVMVVRAVRRSALMGCHLRVARRLGIARCVRVARGLGIVRFVRGKAGQEVGRSRPGARRLGIAVAVAVCWVASRLDQISRWLLGGPVRARRLGAVRVVRVVRGRVGGLGAGGVGGGGRLVGGLGGGGRGGGVRSRSGWGMLRWSRMRIRRRWLGRFCWTS
jgi:hypothetical protein